MKVKKEHGKSRCDLKKMQFLRPRCEIVVKKLLENKEMDFKNWVTNIQIMGYNGTHMVHIFFVWW